MIYVVQQGLFDIEELEKVEVEKAVKTDISRSEIPLVYSSPNIDEPLISIVD